MKMKKKKKKKAKIEEKRNKIRFIHFHTNIAKHPKKKEATAKLSCSSLFSNKD